MKVNGYSAPECAGVPQPDAGWQSSQLAACSIGQSIDPLLLPWSFGYCKRARGQDAIAALTEARDEGTQWVARCDIDDGFEYIPRLRLNS